MVWARRGFCRLADTPNSFEVTDHPPRLGKCHQDQNTCLPQLFPGRKLLTEGWRGGTSDGGMFEFRHMCGMRLSQA